MKKALLDKLKGGSDLKLMRILSWGDFSHSSFNLSLSAFNMILSLSR